MEWQRWLATRKVSVRPSVCQTCGLWQNRRNICPNFYIIWKTIQPSFLRRMVGGSDPGGVSHSTWNFGSTSLHCSEITNFQPIFACSASAITPSEKVELTLIGSLLTLSNEPTVIIIRCFYAPPHKEGLENKIAVFRVKPHFTWRKSATKFWPIYPVPFMWKFGGYWPTRLQITDFQSVFTCSASAVTSSKKCN